MAGLKKSAWLIGIPVLLAIIGAAGLYGWKWRKENAVLALIERVPGTLKAEKAVAGFFDDSIELYKLSGTVSLIPEAPFDIRIEKLRLEGVNTSLARTTGPVKAADRIQVHYLTFDPGENGSLLLGYSFMNVGGYEIDGFWMDWASLRRAMETGPRSAAFADFLLSLRLGRATATDLSVKIRAMPAFEEFSQDDFLMTVGHSEMESYSLLRMGKTASSDFALVYADGARFTIKKMIFDSYSAPESSLRMLVTGDLESDGPEQSRALLQEGYSLRGLSCQQSLVLTENGGRADLPLLLFDMDIGNGKLFVHLEARDMLFSGDILAKAFSEHDKTMESIMRKPRRISAEMDLRTIPGRNGTMRIVYDQELREAELGSANLHFSLKGAAATARTRTLPVTPDSVEFEKGELEIEDNDFLRQYFEAEAIARGGTPSVAEKASELRSAVIQQLRRNAAKEPRPESGPLTRLADFLEHSGRYVLQIRAVQPVSIDNFTTVIGNPDFLELTARHVQAAGE